MPFAFLEELEEDKLEQLCVSSAQTRTATCVCLSAPLCKFLFGERKDFTAEDKNNPGTR